MDMPIDTGSAVPLDGKLPPDDLDTEFKRKYPPDPVIGKEMDEEARVWKVFRDEAGAYDDRMLDGWNKSLDVHLLFAGLFSAVITAFLIESFKRLQFDNDAFTTAALYLLLNATNPDALTDLPQPDLPTGVASFGDRFVNGLWFTSLGLALGSALLAILCKQWLAEYSARSTAPADHPKYWARRRQFLFLNLTDWAIEDVIAVLPGFLHMALGLFLAGLISMLSTVDLAIAISFSVPAFSMSFLISGPILSGIFSPDSPISTPLGKLFRILFARTWHFATHVFDFWLLVLGEIRVNLQRATRRMGWHYHSRDPEDHDGPLRSLQFYRQRLRESKFDMKKSGRLTRNERMRMDRLLDRDKDMLDASALAWLISTSDRNATAVAIQAIGSLHPASQTARTLLQGHEFLSHKDRARFFTPARAATHAVSTWSGNETIRVTRSLLCAMKFRPESLPPKMLEVLMGCDYPDARLISAWIADMPPELPSLVASPSFTSTFMLLLRSDPNNPYILMFGLAGCDFLELEESDWDVIFWGLRTALGDARPLEEDETSHTCGFLCLPGILAVIAGGSHPFAPTAQRIIIRHLEVKITAGSLSFQRHLVRYFGSQTFLDSTPEDVNAYELARRLSLMCISLQRQHKMYLPDVLSVVRTVLHYNNPDAVPYALRVCVNVFSFCATNKTHIDAESMTAVLLPLLDIMLRYFDSHGGRPVWAALHSNGPMAVWVAHPSLMCTLGALLSSALCTVARGGKPISELIAAFFQGESCFDVLRSGLLHEVDRTVVLSYVRHCVELRPAFWINMHRPREPPTPQSEERTSGSDNFNSPVETSDFVAGIESEVIASGPCNQCRGDPIEWIKLGEPGGRADPSGSGDSSLRGAATTVAISVTTPNGQLRRLIT